MRICLTVRALPIHRLGGLEFHTLDLANGLAKRGHDVVIVTSRLGEGASSQSCASGVTVSPLKVGAPGDYSIAFFKEIGRECATLHAAKPFDLIHCQEFAGLFMRSPGCPVVCTIHGTMFSEVPLNRRYFTRLSLSQKTSALWRYKARIALHPFFCSMLKRMDLLFVDSDYTRRELLRINPELRQQISLVPLGIDFSRYSPKPSEAGETLSIALLGRLQEIKGVRVVAEAAELLKQRNVNVKFRIGGSGQYRSELSAFIQSRGLQDRVELSGVVLPEHVSEFLSKSQVFLFPDLTQPAFGLVAVEAMHHRLPVIAARSGAIPETVTEETGWIYDPWNAAELARLIEKIACNRTSLEEKTVAAKSRAAEFPAEKMAARVEENYLKLLSR